MRCPFCGNSVLRVLDSRTAQEGQSIRRRRSCEACQSRFTTFEQVRLRELRVNKTNGHVQPFSLGKLVQSITIACRKRPVSYDQVEQTASRIQNRMEKSGDIEFSSKYIGELVMKELEKLDSVAYIRFASVYRNFREAKDFHSFAKNVESAEPDQPSTPKTSKP